MTSQIDVIQFVDANNALVKAVAAPFKFKAGANVTIAANGSTITVDSSGGGGTVSVSAPLSGNGANASPITMPQANATNNGFLSAADWATFNNAGGAPDPLDTLTLVDDFVFATANNGATLYPRSMGELGWTIVNQGTGAIAGPQPVSAELGHPGIVMIRATSQNMALVSRSNMGSSIMLTGAITGDQLFDMTMIAKFGTYQNNVNMVLGMAASASGAPSHGFFISGTRGASAATVYWQVASRLNNAESNNASTIALSGNWFKFRIRRIDANSAGFTVNNETEIVITSNLATNNSSLFPFILAGSSPQSSDVAIDFFKLSITGLAR